MNKVIWYRDEGERLPGWYLVKRPPFASHRQASLDHMVYDGWMPALRMLYNAQGKVVKNPCAFSRFGWLLRQHIGFQERLHVAETKNRSVAVLGWVNISLTEAHKDDIAQANVSVETMLQDIGALVMRGYRFSMTYDDYSEAIQATLVCANEEDGNFQHGLSARHPDPVMALTTLLYKHALTEETGWREFSKRAKRDSWG
jgi:hypothetical protein